MCQGDNGYLMTSYIRQIRKYTERYILSIEFHFKIEFRILVCSGFDLILVSFFVTINRFVFVFHVAHRLCFLWYFGITTTEYIDFIEMIVIKLLYKDAM